MKTATLETLEAQPPQDIDAERAVLGSLMLSEGDRVAFAKVRQMLSRRSFFLPEHATLFAVLGEMYDANEAIDLITTRARLKQRGMLDDFGGTDHLADIARSVPSPSHGLHYAKIVADRARERVAMDVASRLVERLSEPGGSADAIQRAIKDLTAASFMGRDLNVWKIGEAAERFIERRLSGSAPAIETGIRVLDENYAGVCRKGGYTLVAARPSMGKSCFVRDRLLNRALAGIPCGLIAVEEDEDKIAGNALSTLTEIENSHVANGAWTPGQVGELGTGATRLNQLPLYGIDTAFTLSDVLAAAEILSVQHGCQIIAIDHIHLIQSPRAETREQQISEISGAFKAFIKRSGVCGIVAAQLNRPEKGVCPPPPQLTDLRGSGALEEHADAVLMIHREDYYHRGRDGYTPNGKAQILVRKNRNGCVGDFLLNADLRHQKFTDESHDDPFGTDGI